MTTTGSPLRSEETTLSASLRQQFTVTNEVLPSHHSPVSRSLTREVQATRIDTSGVSSLTVL